MSTTTTTTIARRTLLLGGLLAVCLLFAAAPAAGSEVIAIDDGHDFATNESIATYDETGVVETDVTRLDMTIGVYSTAEAAPVEATGLEVDTTAHYLHIDYREDIPRTIRLYIPAEYWHPYPQKEFKSMNGEHTLEMVPNDDLNYSVITIHVGGETSGTWQIQREAAGYFQVRETSRSLIERETGFRLPSISGASEQWEFVPPSELETEDTIPIEAPHDELTMQYDDLPNETTEQRWIGVPDCTKRRATDAPVCTIPKPDRGYELLVVQTSNPPDVRYKHGQDYLSQLRAAVTDDLAAAPKRAKEKIEGFLGWFF